MLWAVPFRTSSLAPFKILQASIMRLRDAGQRIDALDHPRQQCFVLRLSRSHFLLSRSQLTDLLLAVAMHCGDDLYGLSQRLMPFFEAVEPIANAVELIGNAVEDTLDAIHARFVVSVAVAHSTSLQSSEFGGADRIRTGE